MPLEENSVITWETDLGTKPVYCISTWLRDEQFKLSIARIKKRVEFVEKIQSEPIAIVGLGPSLEKTWKQIKKFKYIMTCSGSHKFLLERGIVPTWHVDVDPRPHKVDLIGKPHKHIKYLIASCCHPKIFDHLEGYDVFLWHVFSTQEEAMRLLPRGEWALTGGSNVGLRAIAMARFLGFTNLHIFGMDGCLGDFEKTHAVKHPNPNWDNPDLITLIHEGVKYKTTPVLLFYAKETFRELDQMPDVKAIFYGDGLIQHIAKTRIPNPVLKEQAILSIRKPETISPEHKERNYKLYLSDPYYGTNILKNLEFVHKLIEKNRPNSILDYGCGRGLLAQSLVFPIWEYDPAIPGKDTPPQPAEMVICVDVLEHVEPDKLIFVLDELRQCTQKLGYFVICLKPARKSYSDGQNTHLIQKPADWWIKIIGDYFTLGEITNDENFLKIIVSPKILNQLKKEEISKIGFFDFNYFIPNRDPYPNSRVLNAIEPAFYSELCKTFPSSELSGNLLNDFVEKTGPWKKFYDLVVSPEFVDKIFAMLECNQIKIVRTPDLKLSSKFEFGIINANGGQVMPYTNSKFMIVTLIFWMLDDDSWNDKWGGGLTIFQPKNPAAKPVSGQADFEEFNIVKTYPYMKNQCLIFLKNNTSWRGVLPMKGPADAMHRMAAITIELTK